MGATAEVGGFFDYWPTRWLRARVELRQGIGGHHGVVSDETVDVVVPVSPQWTLSGGPRLTVATADANRPYFGIDAAQSAASGLPVFDVGGGVRSFGAGTQARYQWNAQWASHAFVEYTRLTGDVGEFADRHPARLGPIRACSDSARPIRSTCRRCGEAEGSSDPSPLSVP